MWLRILSMCFMFGMWFFCLRCGDVFFNFLKSLLINMLRMYFLLIYILVLVFWWRRNLRMFKFILIWILVFVNWCKIVFIVEFFCVICLIWLILVLLWYNRLVYFIINFVVKVLEFKVFVYDFMVFKR